MKKILLLSHELSYTGAPNSLLRIAKVLIKNNFYVEVWSLLDGNFKEEFNKNNIKVLIPNIESNDIYKKISKFDLAIVNTILSHKFIYILGNKINFIWYIREAANIESFCIRYPERIDLLKSVKNIYCVSEYAKSFIEPYNKNVKVVHNCVEDYYNNISNKVNEKINFIMVGTIEFRKGFDILFDAFDELDKQYKDKCLIHIVGRCFPSFKDYYEKILDRIKNNKHIIWHGEITDNNKKINLYKDMNVFVIVSRDESCSLIALEGAMMGKPIIVSENVGAKYIINNNCGWIIRNENILELKNVLIDIIENPRKLERMGNMARKNYLNTSTIDIYEKNIVNLVNENLVNKKYKMLTLFFYLLKMNFSFKKIRNYRIITIFGIKITLKDKKLW